MKHQLKKLVFLLSLISGAAVSVYSADLLIGELPNKGDWRFTLGGEGSYISDIYHDMVEYDAFAGELIFGVGYSVLRGLDFSVLIPVYADMLNSNDATGVGDLELNLFWLPLTDVPVSPVFSLKNIIPTGSDERGLIPRSHNLYSGDFPYYSNSDFSMDISLGVDVDLSKRGMPLRFSYLCTPGVTFADEYYTTLSNKVGIQWFASDYLVPGLSFEVESPVEADDVLQESSFQLSSYLQIRPSNKLDIQTDLSFGLGDARIEREDYEFPVVPLFSFGVTFDFYARKKEAGSEEMSAPADTVPAVVNQVSTASVPDTEPLDSVKVKPAEVVEYTDTDNDGIIDNLDKCPDMPELYNHIDDSDGCPDFEKTATGTTISSYVLQRVEFSSGSTALSYDSKQALNSLLVKLKKNKAMKIELRGFSDYSGGYVTNINISQKRAESVKAYLISEGVDKLQVRAVGYGPNSPVADNRTSKGRRKNRRIEYIILN